MKKFIALLLAVLMLAAASLALAEDKPYAGQTLTISTFSFNAEALKANIYDPFTELTGAQVVAEGASNAVRVSKIAEAAEGTYDVVIIGDMFVKQLMAEGKIDTLDNSGFTNLDALYENAKAPMGEGYGPAYTFNRLGIVYNPEDCPIEIKCFADLWDPELRDYIAIPAITNTSGPLFYYGVAAAFGLEPGQDDDAIFAKLAELKPNVKSTYTSANNTITMLNQGEICAAVLLDYSYTTAKSANPAYVWVNPAEGLFGGYNMLNVITGSKNKELAELFIDFYLSYEVQYAEAMDGVDSPVRTDIVLDEEHAQNFTYGDMVNQLILPDWDFVTENLAAWTEQWNNTFGVK